VLELATKSEGSKDTTCADTTCAQRFITVRIPESKIADLIERLLL
jgi:hypothetical protein